MCFSPEADLVAAVVIGGIGVDATRHVRSAAQWPLAALPLLLAGHSLIEAFVWWGVRGDVSGGVQTVATALYVGIAFVVLPVYIPVTVLLLENRPFHRPAEIVTLVAGVVCATELTAALIARPYSASPHGHHLVYHVHLHAGAVITALYLLSTCGALLVSGRPFLRWYGVVNIAAVAMLAWVALDALTSLWCAWAAVTSIAVAVRLRSGAPPVASRRSPAAAGEVTT